jgi:hypothetical protein
MSHNKVQEAFKQLGDARENLKNVIVERSQELGITRVKLTSESEYNDNNYFTKYYLKELNDVDSLHIDYYDLDEGWGEAMQILQDLQAKKSTLFITDDQVSIETLVNSNTDIIEDFKSSYSYDPSVVDCIISFYKQGYSEEHIQEIGRHVLDILDLDEYSIPGEYQE